MGAFLVVKKTFLSLMVNSPDGQNSDWNPLPLFDS